MLKKDPSKMKKGHVKRKLNERKRREEPNTEQRPVCRISQRLFQGSLDTNTWDAPRGPAAQQPEPDSMRSTVRESALIRQGLNSLVKHMTGQNMNT